VRCGLYDRLPSVRLGRDLRLRDQRQHRRRLVRQQLHGLHGTSEWHGHLQRRRQLRARLQHRLPPVRHELRREQQRRVGMQDEWLHGVRAAREQHRRLQWDDLQPHLRNRLPRLPVHGADVVCGEQQHGFGLHRQRLHRLRRPAER